MRNTIEAILLFFSLTTFGQEISKLKLNQIISTDGIYVETDGTIYATEGWDGDKIYKISPLGEVHIFAIGLKGPIDILKGRDGNFYVSEWNASQLSKVNQKGTVSKFAITKPGPGAMTQDREGNLYVTHNINDGSGYISKISLSGTVSIFSEGNLLINPGGIDFDSKGNLYVSNFNNANIIKIRPDGSSEILGTVPGNKQWRTGHLKIVDDVIFVSALMENRIYKASLDGNIRALADVGKPETEIGDSKSIQLFNPNGLYFNKASEQLYATVAFSKVGFIQKINLGVTPFKK